jgi:hypothetical protein
VNEDVAAADPGGVDEVVALRQELSQVLLRGVGRADDEVFLFLKCRKNRVIKMTRYFLS